MSLSNTVLVTGASGFIALHVIDLLLSKNYPVIGTARTQEKADFVVSRFKIKYPNANIKVVIVKNIAIPNAFDSIFKENKDIKYVIHVASPVDFTQTGDSEEYFLKPAVNGTLNILNGIKNFAPQVIRVVITSSMAAVAEHSSFSDALFICSEEIWSPITWDKAKDNNITAYMASKKYAEKTAWDFLKDENPNFSLTTVIPPYVFGPQVFEDSLSKSLNETSKIIPEVLTREDNQTDPNAFNNPSAISADVRDIALLHVLAIENDYSNKRLFIVQGKFSGQEILNIANEHFPELKGKIPKGVPNAVEDHHDHTFGYNCDATLKLTGIKLIYLEKTVADVIQQILNYQKKTGKQII
ncbi:hypothetical protein PACTADRAFT_1171 [Pachysolen tannophilus NRRL Y-2460]|uniref:NAD-dependent epimerase/dehydratase domain-containing protein n=1 Tax=Pachysolen tannophilus NRRL Y-2460 TaxID=669874 RepID=A0A1E4TXX6_PACTA|nr:hypothetical protein PACTADRAFT_1171 [Pachysolen tannophilus NRRL Y-2460]